MGGGIVYTYKYAQHNYTYLFGIHIQNLKPIVLEEIKSLGSRFLAAEAPS
jgi:hypothetical protein